MFRRSRLGNEKGFWSLIGLLVAVAIGFAIYSYVLVPGMSKRDQQTRRQAQEAGVKLNANKSLPGAAMDAGKDTACKAQLDQIRQAIVMYKNENDKNPGGFADLRLPVAPHFFQCPAGKEAYVYDANAGTVQCAHPGHQGL